jgi:small-conductance mechanosensitive channel
MWGFKPSAVYVGSGHSVAFDSTLLASERIENCADRLDSPAPHRLRWSPVACASETVGSNRLLHNGIAGKAALTCRCKPSYRSPREVGFMNNIIYIVGLVVVVVVILSFLGFA